MLGILGGESEGGNLVGARLEKLGPHQLVSEWCAWELGDEGWWGMMKIVYDLLSRE